MKTHIKDAFAKIDARNRADAVRYGFQQGLVQL
ncbi:response regulator transcription factor [Streptomyces sp. SID1046]|nr:response regulator transcription factor [Streptomyces sp. SID1046]